MTPLKQALLCVPLLAAIGGWYVYSHPEVVGLASGDAASDDGGRRGGSGGGGGRRGGGGRIPGLIGGGGAVNVVTSPVEMDRSGETLVALGTAEAARSVVIFPQVNGIVDAVTFAAGQPVTAGDVLVHLEDSEQQVAVDRARVTIKQTADALERAQTLSKSRTITSVALSEADTAARLAEIELRSAEIALDRRSIKAPFDGIPGLTDISPGDLVTSTTQITTLEDLGTVRVDFEVPERFAGRIGEGDAITAQPQGDPGTELDGRIVGIDNRIDATTRTLRLQAELDNTSQRLKTGMAIMVKLDFDTTDQLAVPTLAIQWDRAGSFVWKVVDEAARRAKIDILRRQSGVVVVKGEVEAGDEVVVEGIQRLREGTLTNDVGEEAATADAEPPPAPAEPQAAPAASAAPPSRTRG